MQNYYRILGVGPTATAAEITQAYQRQRTRLTRLAGTDRAMKNKLAEVETGYDILGHARRRVAYDTLLEQEPPAPAPRLQQFYEQLFRYARVARSLNVALLACCLLLAIDWALPQREFPHETVRRRVPIGMTSSLADPQLSYRVHTDHAMFRLPGPIGYRIREYQTITVWKTPLLGVVQRVSAPASPDGPAPFRPYGGTIYGTLAWLPLLLGAVTIVGVWPGRSPELYVNTAAVSGLLAILAVIVLLWF